LPEAVPLRPGFRVLWVALLVCLFMMMPVAAPAQLPENEESQPEVWLLTYGPGEVYWQRFGHNAIWIVDHSGGLNHTFNFGFFDFTQQGFLKNFIFGRLNYFAAARPAKVELSEYVDADRSVRAQRINIDAARIGLLSDFLITEISDENREYLYDYYLHNCSTRVRDAIDLVLNGALKEEFDQSPASLNYRDHTRRLTQMDPIYYLGLQAGLGSPVDQPVSRWDEMFIPGVLADALTEAIDPYTGQPVVTQEVMLHVSSMESPPALPDVVWYRYLAGAVAILLIGVALSFIPRVTARQLATSWLLTGGFLGLVLAFLWLGTDHWVSALNLNLLLLNPLWLFVMFRALQKPLAWLVVVCGLVALAAPWYPPWQYNADVVALILPLNLLSSVLLLKSGSKLSE